MLVVGTHGLFTTFLRCPVAWLQLWGFLYFNGDRCTARRQMFTNITRLLESHLGVAFVVFCFLLFAYLLFYWAALVC